MNDMQHVGQFNRCAVAALAELLDRSQEHRDAYADALAAGARASIALVFGLDGKPEIVVEVIGTDGARVEFMRAECTPATRQ